jgi:hypothetical protein
MASGRFNLNMRNGPHSLPADFLIGSDGTIVALKYGDNAYYQLERRRAARLRQRCGSWRIDSRAGSDGRMTRIMITAASIDVIDPISAVSLGPKSPYRVPWGLFRLD